MIIIIFYFALSDAECLVFSNYSEVPVLAGSREYAIAVKLTVPETNHEDCMPMSLLPLIYVVYYAPVVHTDSESCQTNVSLCQQIVSASVYRKLNGLVVISFI